MPKDNQEYVIGVDGGGTKTVVALADFNGKILKIAQSGPSNLRNLGIKKSVNNIVGGLTKLLPKKKKIKVNSTFIGLPALEEEFKTKKDNIKIIMSIIIGNIFFISFLSFSLI